jgi:predicted RNase H-related nuclease YkuK (DUF458 family)
MKNGGHERYNMDINEFKNLIKENQFRSPSKGLMSFKEVIEELIEYRDEKPEFEYRIVIGTDSEARESGVDFVSVVAIHRIGKGGRYFWLRIYDKEALEFRNRIYKEAVLSLALAYALLEQQLENNHMSIVAGQSIKEAIENLGKNLAGKSAKKIVLTDELEIHVDIGTKGPTKAMIKEIVGMIRGSGFDVKIKPEAFAAANVADRHV